LISLYHITLYSQEAFARKS